MVCLNKERSLGSQTSIWQAARAGHFINGSKLSPAGHSGSSAAARGSCTLPWQRLSLPERLNSLCTKFVIFLFFQQAQMFSKARLEDKKKKLSFLITWREQASLQCSVNPCPWSQLHTLFPSLPRLGSAQGWEEQCRCQGCHKHCHSRFLGLLRTERSNNDSALSKQLPVVLKLLQT